MSASQLDALPYHDKQVEDYNLKAKAASLIDAELKEVPPVALDDPRLPADVDVFPKSQALSSLLANYADQPIRGIDPSKYAPPVPLEDATTEDLVELEKRGRIGEGHMAVRNENIGILQSYGSNAWLVRNYQLNSQVKELQETLTEIQEQVTGVNRSRRVQQEEAGEHLGRLENRWQDLVSSTVQLEMACAAMEGEVSGLRQREDALRLEVAQLEASS